MNQNATYSRKAIGFGAYSEGASDDLNKALWSVIYMEPSTTADEVVGQYARHFLGDNETAGAALLSGLERNWDGNALSNTHVATTLATAQQLDRESSKNQPNWRLQAHTFRAFYDSYVQARAQWENKAEQAIMNAVADATLKTDASPAEALKLLKQRWIPGSNVTAWKARAFELAAALNHSLGGCVYIASQSEFFIQRDKAHHSVQTNCTALLLLQRNTLGWNGGAAISGKCQLV
eukprot:COSAG02_NODE_527_length_20704_cov_120.745462_5_plen_235_part_00